MPKKKKKRKNKPSVSQKVIEAQKFKDFKKRLFLMARACGAEEELRSIPRSELNYLYDIHVKPFDIIPAKDQNLPNKIYKLLKFISHFYLKMTFFKFYEEGPEVNLYEYLSTGITLYIYANNIKNENFKGKEALEKALKSLISLTKSEDAPWRELGIVSYLMAGLLNKANHGYWTFEHQITKHGSSLQHCVCFETKFIPPKKIYIKQNGHSRPAFRVGYTETGIELTWLQITPEQLNIESPFSDLKIDVYIQNHAINRLVERLDCVSENVCHYLLYKNLQQWETFTFNGHQLIVFSTDEEKIGYLVFEYTQGVVLIKTFLLLTHKNTPEGEELEKLLKLEKRDRQYFHLDKLSHFVNSDIPQNKILWSKFVKAGCDNLFKMDKSKLKSDNTINKHARLIEEYISTAQSELEKTI